MTGDNTAFLDQRTPKYLSASKNGYCRGRRAQACFCRQVRLPIRLERRLHYGCSVPPCGYCPAVGSPARTAAATAAPGAVRRRAPAGGNRRRGFAERGGVLLRPRGWRRQGRLHRAVQFHCTKRRFCSRKTAFFLKIIPLFLPSPHAHRPSSSYRYRFQLRPR